MRNIIPEGSVFFIHYNVPRNPVRLLRPPELRELKPGMNLKC